MALIIARAGKAELMESADMPFKDQEHIPDWARSSVAWVLSKDLMKGYPDGTFQARRSATRAEACVVLGKLINNN